jgi:hypothetical protein
MSGRHLRGDVGCAPDEILGDRLANHVGEKDPEADGGEGDAALGQSRGQHLSAAMKANAKRRGFAAQFF